MQSPRPSPSAPATRVLTGLRGVVLATVTAKLQNATTERIVAAINRYSSIVQDFLPSDIENLSPDVVEILFKVCVGVSCAPP